MAKIRLFEHDFEIEHVPEDSVYGVNEYRIIDPNFGRDVKIGNLQPGNAYVVEDFPDDGQPSYSIGFIDVKNHFIPVVEWESDEWESSIKE